MCLCILSHSRQEAEQAKKTVTVTLLMATAWPHHQTGKLKRYFIYLCLFASMATTHALFTPEQEEFTQINRFYCTVIFRGFIYSHMKKTGEFSITKHITCGQLVKVSFSLFLNVNLICIYSFKTSKKVMLDHNGIRESDSSTSMIETSDKVCQFLLNCFTFYTFHPCLMKINLY